MGDSALIMHHKSNPIFLLRHGRFVCAGGTRLDIVGYARYPDARAPLRYSWILPARYRLSARAEIW